jgi:predicted transcriptional regulator
MREVSFTDRELDVMAVLWELGSATVPEVRARLADDLAYTTVQTVLRTLEAKGYVTHDEEGRFHRYRPLVEREQAGRSGLRRLLDTVFAGSPEMLVTQLVSEGALTESQVKRLRQLLDQHHPEEE